MSKLRCNFFLNLNHPRFIGPSSRYSCVVFIRSLAWHAYTRDVSRCCLADQRNQSRSRCCVEKMVRLSLRIWSYSYVNLCHRNTKYYYYYYLFSRNTISFDETPCIILVSFFRTLRANFVHQDLPKISRCHSYTINAKYTYRCTNNACANTWVFRIGSPYHVSIISGVLSTAFGKSSSNFRVLPSNQNIYSPNIRKVVT